LIIKSVTNLKVYNEKIAKLNKWQASTGANNTTEWMSEQYISLYKKFALDQNKRNMSSMVAYE